MPQSVPEASASGRLPPLIRRYLDRALPRDSDAVRQILITQTGEMFRKPGAKAIRFTASERFAVDRVAFCWKARFAVARVISLKVVDQCSHGRGALTLRVLGVPVQRQSGAEVDVGEAYRYLAELPWVPHAMAMNPELEWHEVDERRVDVATTVAMYVRGCALTSTRQARSSPALPTRGPEPSPGNLCELAGADA
jgi:hypothetical protein